MLSLCQPYGATITCLCDKDNSVLRCFLTGEEGDRMNHMQEDKGAIQNNGVEEQSSKECSWVYDMRTEMIIAGAILVIIVGLVCL